MKALSFGVIAGVVALSACGGATSDVAGHEATAATSAPAPRAPVSASASAAPSASASASASPSASVSATAAPEAFADGVTKLHAGAYDDAVVAFRKSDGLAASNAT